MVVGEEIAILIENCGHFMNLLSFAKSLHNSDITSKN